MDLDISVDEAVARQPQLARLFVHRHMICVGCYIARFHTLRDVALMYHINLDEFEHDIELILASNPRATNSESSPPTQA